MYEDTPKLAQTGIGQNDVRATPLQMALVAAGVANEGRIMTPHVMSAIRARDGEVVTAVRREPMEGLDVLRAPRRRSEPT